MKTEKELIKELMEDFFTRVEGFKKTLVKEKDESLLREFEKVLFPMYVLNQQLLHFRLLKTNITKEE